MDRVALLGRDRHRLAGAVRVPPARLLQLIDGRRRPFDWTSLINAGQSESRALAMIRCLRCSGGK